MDIFKSKLDDALGRLDLKHVKSVVAAIQSGNCWLLGLSSARDDRQHKWCFPGGHLRPNEAYANGVERETKEETGIRCKAGIKPILIPSKPDVLFLHCKASKDQRLVPNKEFIILGWFDTTQMKGLKLHQNVLQIINKIQRR